MKWPLPLPPPVPLPPPLPSPPQYDSGAGVHYSSAHDAGWVKTVPWTNDTNGSDTIHSPSRLQTGVQTLGGSPSRLQSGTLATGGSSSSRTRAASVGVAACSGDSIANPFFRDANGPPFTAPFVRPSVSAAPPIEHDDPGAHVLDDMDIDIPRCAHKMLREWVRRARFSMALMPKQRYIMQKHTVPRNILLQLDNWSEIEHLCLMEPEAIVQAQLAHISNALSTTRAFILEGVDDPKVRADARGLPAPHVPFSHPSATKALSRPPPLPVLPAALPDPDPPRPQLPQIKNGAFSAQTRPPSLTVLPEAIPDPDSSRSRPLQIENVASNAQKRPPPLPMVPAALPDPARPQLPQVENGALSQGKASRLRQEDPGESWECRFDAALESHLSKKRRRQEMAREHVVVLSRQKMESPPDIAQTREDEVRQARELAEEKKRLTKLMAKFGELDIASWHKATKEAAAHKLMQEQLEQQQALAEVKWRAEQEELTRVRLVEQAHKEQEWKLAEQKAAEDKARLAEKRRVPVAAGRNAKEAVRNLRAAPLDDFFRCLEDSTDEQQKEKLHATKAEEDATNQHQNEQRVMKTEEDARKREKEEARKAAREKARTAKKASQQNSQIDDMFATLEDRRVSDMFDILEGD